MDPVDIHQAKTQLSQLLHLVEQGEEVVIARSGVPIARLVHWQRPGRCAARSSWRTTSMHRWITCSRHWSDAAAARHPSGAVVAE
jgi:antitoxin (DNA-binding transcriptional repressor) of toxin-antitoxin stability system